MDVIMDNNNSKTRWVVGTTTLYPTRNRFYRCSIPIRMRGVNGITHYPTMKLRKMEYFNGEIDAVDIGILVMSIEEAEALPDFCEYTVEKGQFELSLLAGEVLNDV